MEWYHYYLWTQQPTDRSWQCSLLCHCHPHKLPHDWSSEMYHIKFHFTTVNDDESAKNNQIVSSFPEETNNTEDVSSVSGMIPQFYPDGACLWGFRKYPQKVSCLTLYLAVLVPAVYT